MKMLQRDSIKSISTCPSHSIQKRSKCSEITRTFAIFSRHMTPEWFYGQTTNSKRYWETIYITHRSSIEWCCLSHSPQKWLKRSEIAAIFTIFSRYTTPKWFLSQTDSTYLYNDIAYIWILFNLHLGCFCCRSLGYIAVQDLKHNIVKATRRVTVIQELEKVQRDDELNFHRYGKQDTLCGSMYQLFNEERKFLFSQFLYYSFFNRNQIF